MMGIRPMDVCMCQLLVYMGMVVRLQLILFAVWMAVMLILVMRMLMTMCDSFMNMGMFMPFPVKT